MTASRFFPKPPIGRRAVNVTYIELKKFKSIGAKNKDVLVTIVEVGDYGCPDCLEVENWTKKILKEIPETRLFFLPASFEKRPAGSVHGRIAMDSNAIGKFWEAHRLIWKNFRDDADTTLAAIRRTLRLDEATEETILPGDAIYAEAKLSWVPTFFVNGVPYFGVDPEPLRRLVDDQLLFAKEVAAETKFSGNKLYKELVSRNGK